MAEAKGEYIAVNELKGTVSTTAKDAVSVMYGSNKVRIAWAEGKRVWDVWETMLSANNSSISSSATTITESLFGLQSYGTDRLGVKHQMTGSEHIEFSPSSIGANNTTNSRTQNVVITQKKSGKSITVTATQAGRVAQSTTYGTPSVTSTSISTIAASGNVTRYLTVNWSQSKITTYDNGTTSSTTVTGSSTATVTSGSSQNSSGAYISGGGVYVPSAGTNYFSSTHNVFYISGYEYYANGVRGTGSGVYVQRNKNTYTTGTNYNVSCGSANVSSIANVGGSFTFTAVCQSRTVYYYDSGVDDYGSWTNLTGSVTYSDGVSSVSHTSFSGEANITAYVSENFGSARNPRVTISCSGRTDYTQVSQTAVSYTFSSVATGEIAQSGGTFKVYLNSFTNQTGVEPTCTVSGITGATITSVKVLTSYTAGNIEVTLNVPSNSSTSTRTLTLKATHPVTGQTLTIPITQKANTAVTRLSIAKTSYFQKSGTQYRFVGTIDVETTQSQTISGTWYYVAVDSEGLSIGSVVADTKGVVSFSINSSTKTVSYTGNYVTIEGVTAADFAGIRAELRNSPITLNGVVTTIK